jgi:serine protease AprX
MIRHQIAMFSAVPFILLPFYAGAGQGPIHRADLKAGKIVSAVIDPAPRVIETNPAPRQQERPLEPIPPHRKLHPRLLALLESNVQSETKVVILFEETIEIPRFPALDPRYPRNHPKNDGARSAAARLVRELQDKRVETYRQHAAELAKTGAKVIETFWLIDAVVAEMPVKKLLTLAKREEVLSIVPVDSGEPPPHDGNDNNDVDDGRTRIVSDPYFELSGGFIGLLDSGVRSLHEQFKDPSTLDFHLDCVNGGADCMAGGNPDDDCWNHGTSTAAILTGNNQIGEPYRGVTKITVDSFKIYPSVFNKKYPLCDSVASGLDTAAAVRGFQAAVAVLDQVIVAQIQQEGENGAVAQAANAAFDAGTVVVAANGNDGESTEDGSVAEPASASRVLGVGNFDVVNGSQINEQGRGPGIDGRIKPDIQAPTNTETAGNGCLYMRDCRGVVIKEALRPFSGTSGAVPYAAGAAALLRNLVARTMKTNAVDPGLVYALMILSGQRPKFDNDHGAGPLRLPTDGTLLWGVVTVKHGDTFEVPVHVHPHQKIVDAALWWPEDLGGHNNVDLTIVDPNGKEEASNSLPSVFERARVEGATKGKWRILIHGRSVPLGPQRVYFAIFTQG